jgi:hypothetical protein
MGMFGNAMRDAYDDMGGITLNVANIGAMLDFMATAVGRADFKRQCGVGPGCI